MTSHVAFLMPVFLLGDVKDISGLLLPKEVWHCNFTSCSLRSFSSLTNVFLHTHTHTGNTHFGRCFGPLSQLCGCIGSISWVVPEVGRDRSPNQNFLLTPLFVLRLIRFEHNMVTCPLSPNCGVPSPFWKPWLGYRSSVSPYLGFNSPQSNIFFQQLQARSPCL